MVDDNLRDIQLSELNMLKKIIEITEQNNLTYYALGGTLLGAVRHHGFIPWDDDIDIGMPRPEYEKFIKIAEESLKPPLDIATTLNGHSKYAYYYPRVIDTSIELIRKGGCKNEKIIHPWIDIFKLDRVPKDDEELNKWYRSVNRLWTFFKISQYEYFTVKPPKLDKNSILVLLKSSVLCILFYFKLYKLFNRNRLWGKLDRKLKKYDYDSSSRLINATGYWGIKELFPKSVYGEGKMFPFEDILIRGPENYDYVLNQMYGDYMTPPPEDKKEHHNITYLRNVIESDEKNGRNI